MCSCVGMCACLIFLSLLQVHSSSSKHHVMFKQGKTEQHGVESFLAHASLFWEFQSHSQKPFRKFSFSSNCWKKKSSVISLWEWGLGLFFYRKISLDLIHEKKNKILLVKERERERERMILEWASNRTPNLHRNWFKARWWISLILIKIWQTFPHYSKLFHNDFSSSVYEWACDPILAN